MENFIMKSVKRKNGSNHRHGTVSLHAICGLDKEAMDLLKHVNRLFNVSTMQLTRFWMQASHGGHYSSMTSI